MKREDKRQLYLNVTGVLGLASLKRVEWQRATFIKEERRIVLTEAKSYSEESACVRDHEVQITDTNTAMVLSSLGYVYSMLGNFFQAENFFTKFTNIRLAMPNSLDNTTGLLAVQNNLAGLWSNMGKNDKVRRALQANFRSGC